MRCHDYWAPFIYLISFMMPTWAYHSYLINSWYLIDISLYWMPMPAWYLLLIGYPFDMIIDWTSHILTYRHEDIAWWLDIIFLGIWHLGWYGFISWFLGRVIWHDSLIWHLGDITYVLGTWSYLCWFACLPWGVDQVMMYSWTCIMIMIWPEGHHMMLRHLIYVYRWLCMIAFMCLDLTALLGRHGSRCIHEPACYMI